jgi:GDP-L-fucose synthase
MGRRIVGYEGDVVLNRSDPDGTPRKLLDVSRLRALGWQPVTELHAGIADTYRWYQTAVAGAPDSG